MDRRYFYEVVSAAIADFVEHGFDSQERLDRWLSRIRQAALQALVPEHELVVYLRASLTRAFQGATAPAVLERRHRGIPEFTLERIKPTLHAELDRRILASANLIKLNREGSIQRTLQRFSGWATSIPIGGTEATNRRETAEEVRRSIAGLPYRERFVIYDQGAKLAASINDVVARNGGAIALIWHHIKQGPPAYDARPEHVSRNGKIYLLRDSWAVKDGLVKLAGRKYYDEVTAVAEEPGCSCFATYLYVPSALPPDMWTEKGRRLILQFRAAENMSKVAISTGASVRTELAKSGLAAERKTASHREELARLRRENNRMKMEHRRAARARNVRIGA